MEVSQLNPSFAMQGSTSQAQEKLSPETIAPLGDQVKISERLQKSLADRQHQVQGTLEIRPEPSKMNFSQKELLQLSSEVKKKLNDAGIDISMRVDKESDRILVEIRDPESGEVVRQIPPETHLKIVESLREVQPPVQMTGMEVDLKF